MMQHVSLMLTDRCNSRCRYCYVDAKTEKSIENTGLDTDLVRDFLQAFASRNGKIVHFTGGEVLLHPEVEQILEFAKSLGLSVQIFTNGLLLDEERFLRIKDFVGSFAISLDGSEGIHDANRGVRGAYQKVIEVLQLFKTHYVEYSLQMTIGKSNLDQIEHVAAIASQYNAGSVKLANLMQVGRGAACPAEHLSEDDLLAIKHKAAQISEQYSYRPIFQTNLYTREEMAMYFKTDALLPSYWVDASGDLCLFTPSHKEHFKIGHISDLSCLDDEFIRKKSQTLVSQLLPKIREKRVCDLYEEIERLASEMDAC